MAQNRPGPIAGFEKKMDSERADVDAVLSMAPTDQETEVVPPAEAPEELPLPSDPKVIFLGGLFVLALLATAYVASEIVLPLVFAIILKLLLQPAMRLLERLHAPRILAALLLILVLFGTIVGLGTAISGPAGTWAAKLPEGGACGHQGGSDAGAACRAVRCPSQSPARSLEDRVVKVQTTLVASPRNHQERTAASPAETTIASILASGL